MIIIGSTKVLRDSGTMNPIIIHISVPMYLDYFVLFKSGKNFPNLLRTTAAINLNSVNFACIID
jgi:hypothetical protein